MNFPTFKGLTIGKLFAKVPIVQGGMGVGVSLSGLAAATANEGGIGVIAAAAIGLLEKGSVKDYFAANIRRLKAEIRKARELTNGILGVNIMAALTDFSAMVKAAIDEGIDIIFAGAGLPMNLPSYLGAGQRTRLVPIVSSARAATLIAKHWTAKYDYLPDAFVVEGPMAGGHLGFKRENLEDPDYSLDQLVPELVGALKPFEEKYGRAVPVIAGGGIYTGADVKRMLDLGAAGVQMATRFVTTVECDADPAFKESYIAAKEGDLRIIASPVGMPGRAINNDFLDEMRRGNTKPPACPYHCVSSCKGTEAPYCISLALKNAVRGKLKRGFAFAGANAYLADKIVTVKELFANILEEFKAAVAKVKA